MLTACQIAVVLVVLHFLSDWVLQSRDMARDKSKDFWAMCSHCLIVWIVMFLGMTFCDVWSPEMRLFFCCANSIFHGIIDFSVWYVYAKLHSGHIKIGEVKSLITDDGKQYDVMLQFNEKMLPNEYGFFLTIAIDQTMHLAILMLLFMPM